MVVIEVGIGSLLSIASFGAGAYHGYCDAQGIPLPKDSWHWGLSYGPALIQGGIGACAGGILGTIVGGATGFAAGSAAGGLEAVILGTGGAVIGGTIGVVTGGVTGIAIGGVQTLFGYGVGYGSGYLLR